MSLADRFRDWIDSLSMAWKDRLRGWMASWVTRAGNELLESLEPQTKDLMTDFLTKSKENPNIPPEIRDIIDKSLSVGDPVDTIIGYLFTIIGMAGAVMSAGGPVGREISYYQDRISKSYRLDPISVITAWRRDPEKYAHLFDDLKDLGWDDDRLEALKFFTLFYPSPMDLVRWQAREVFEPAMITKYGLKDELGELRREDFYKAGMSDEQIDNFWMAHWEHPELRTVIEMLRRTDFTEDDMRDWFRLVEIPPYWRDKLIEISYEIPTRVDVRRWWDMRTIDEARLREIYAFQGYHGKDLDDYVLWTKVYVAFPDLIARWRNGWITLDEVKSELTGYGMPAARMEELIQTKIKTVGPERVEGERDLTKTDIYKGVKTGAITRGEAAELLMDLGFDAAEADYLLDINIPLDSEDVIVVQRDLTKADILKGLKAAVITRIEANDRLLDLRYSAPDAEFLLKIFDAQVSPPVEPKLKEASKADILLGVKKGLISSTEGYGMLLDLTFTPEAADFILMVKAEESPFSPINFAEFKDLTQKYRQAAGMGVVYMTEEIKKAAEEVVTLTGDVKALERSIVEEKRGLILGEPIPEAATRRLKTLQVKRNRAIAELEEAKTEYNRQVAEWKHGLPA